VGMLVQAFGFYVGLTNATNKVGQSLKEWAGRISLHPKNRDNYATTPYSEIAPIEAALHGLSSEIETLTDLARKEGALSTLRSVGHDILNPVSRMKRIIGVLKAENHSSFDADLVTSLEANVKRLSSYAEQLKFIYKNQVGELNKRDSIANVSVELSSLAHELSSDPLTQEKDLKIECSVEPDLIALIPPAALGRVIENLCTNSIQASSQSGTLKLLAVKKNERVVVTVSDQGHGISKDLTEKVFEAGFTSRPNQGTGLGLFVVKQICEQYGGSVALESQENKGTTISIELPRMTLALILEHELPLVNNYKITPCLCANSAGVSLPKALVGRS
jgi:two-component system, NtrC family, nitrogen regulation sensor histidine kinase NtrY